MNYHKIEDLTEDHIPEGDLVVLVGKNNTGKTRVLKKWNEILSERSDYISPSRFNFGGEQMPPDADKELHSQKQSRSRIREDAAETSQPQTFLELVNLEDAALDELVKWHNEYFDMLDIRKKNSRKRFSQPIVSIDGRDAVQAGSGSRAVLSLLCRLFDPEIDYLFIDEPEIGLEPRMQRNLRELIARVASGDIKGHKKKVVISTHSNLFVGKGKASSNYIIEKDSSDMVSFKKVETDGDLIALSFNMLGASPADLLFPENILIVEGRTDHAFLSKVFRLKYPDSHIAIHFSEGIGNVEKAIPAIDQMLKSLSYLSLYKDKICVLVDEVEEKKLTKWREYLGDIENVRVHGLSKNGIEFYYPGSIMKKLTGLDLSQQEDAIDGYLNKVKKDKSTMIGTLKITKEELVEKVVNEISSKNLSEINSMITGIIDTCYNRRFK